MSDRLDGKNSDAGERKQTSGNQQRPEIGQQRPEILAEVKKQIASVLDARPTNADLSSNEREILDQHAKLLYEKRERDLPNINHAKDVVWKAVGISPEMQQIQKEFNMLVLPKRGDQTYYQPLTNTLFIGMNQPEKEQIIQSIVAMSYAHTSYITPELSKLQKDYLVNSITYKALENLEAKGKIVTQKNSESLLKGPGLQEVFAMKAPETIYAELLERDQCHVKPLRLGDAEFDTIIEGRVHWAVIADENTGGRQMIFLPERAQIKIMQEGYKQILELTHASMTGGIPVFAVGDADIYKSGSTYYLDYISNGSGHYKPTRASLQIGLDMMAKIGIQRYSEATVFYEPLSK